MFTSLESYEQFIYQLPGHYPIITTSTLVLIRYGRYTAQVRGDIHFATQVRLQVYEELVALQQVRLTAYGYEAWRGDEKLYWYDPQPHPHIPALASTHPHHKHIPPDMKHHRVPASGLSFTQPNLPFLIREIEQLL
ncbi:MAG: hypothetical protein HND44_03830 [Chloroflexi bacterium]|nr:hypothetical protein [Ardenticatenaceae bacterium]MBL1127630.1 hypothetical protein [Chloroflexota bacterium]NOG33695.1 hypothetical protein [Chloroflexota bacterium]GIK56015.1 MAG: hypothetical protein BroJett015_16780 [Chloroflexota bacterium]